MEDIDKDSGPGGGTSNWSPYGRPADVDMGQLERIRAEAIESQLKDLPGENTYLEDSQFMPPWECAGCGTLDIPCAQAACPHCGQSRPVEYRDPEQGEETPDGQIGDYRKKARGQQTRLDFPQDSE